MAFSMSSRQASIRSGSQFSATHERAQIQLPSSVRSVNKKRRLDAKSRATSVATPSLPVIDQPALEFSPEDEDDNSNLIDEVFMAIDMRNRDTIGSAYYVTAEETLYISADIKYGGLDIIDKLRCYAEPSVILISSRVDETVEDCLRTGTDEQQGSGNNLHPAYALEVRPSHEFGYDGAVRKLLDLDLDIFQNAQATFLVPGDDDPATNYRRGLEPGLSHVPGNTLQLSSAIDMESRLSVSCAGAILAYIQRRKAAVHLPGDPAARETFKITYLESFGVGGVMSLSSDALLSMQILQDDFHPSAQNQGPTNAASGSKEGLSVYGLFQHLARTPQARHDAITTFLHPDNEQQLQSLVKNLKNVTNMRTTMQALKKGISNGTSKGGGIKSSIWFRIRSFAYYVLMIEQEIRCLTYADDLEIRNKIFEGIDRQALGQVGRSIIEVIDFGGSQVAHRTVVLQGVDNALDEMKRQYDGLEDMLNHVSRQIGSTIPPEFATDLNVVFFPQIGFLIAMPVNPVTETVYYRDPDWEQTFYTTERVYFKDFRMIELDETIGDIYADICDREIEIVHDLAQRVLEFADTLIRASDICGELDCVTALSQGAKMYNLTRPIMTADNVLQVTGGWHVLQAMIVPSCVANDANLRAGTGEADANDEDNHDQPQDIPPSTVILTGPNYSGKSVYLKQNAIIVYLAHVGSFVPAAQATVGITDQILTRITTRETVSRMQSAFLIDLQQISSALYTMTRQSLLIIDEFGKGTNTANGIGLMAGLLQYLLDLGEDRPKALVATHFHEIFEGGYLGEQPHLGFAHMELRMDRDAAEIKDQVTYLYNLIPGRSTSSFGTVCAALNGIEPDTIHRAEYLLLQEARGVDLIDLCAGTEEQELKAMFDAEEVAKALLRLDLDDDLDDSIDPQEWLDMTLAATSSITASTELESGNLARHDADTSGDW